MRMIIKREIKNNIKSMAIWALCMGAVIFAMAMCFQSMGADINKAYATLPKSMLQAFGMNSVTLGSLESSYSEGYIIVTLMGSLYIAYLAASMHVKEEDEGSIEYLMCKPFSRMEIYFSKYAALVILVLMMNIVIAAATIGGALIYGGSNYSFRAIYLMSSAPILLHLTFGSLCFGFASLIKKNRQAVQLSIGIVSTFYMMSVLGGVSEKLDRLKKISIFDYISINVVAGDKYIEPFNMIIMAAVVIISVAFGSFVYNNKDF